MLFFYNNKYFNFDNNLPSEIPRQDSPLTISHIGYTQDNELAIRSGDTIYFPSSNSNTSNNTIFDSNIRDADNKLSFQTLNFTTTINRDSITNDKISPMLYRLSSNKYIAIINYSSNFLVSIYNSSDLSQLNNMRGILSDIDSHIIQNSEDSISVSNCKCISYYIDDHDKSLYLVTNVGLIHANSLTWVMKWGNLVISNIDSQGPAKMNSLYIPIKESSNNYTTRDLLLDDSTKPIHSISVSNSEIWNRKIQRWIDKYSDVDIYTLVLNYLHSDIPAIDDKSVKSILTQANEVQDYIDELKNIADDPNSLLTTSMKNKPNGYAGLDADGKLPVDPGSFTVPDASESQGGKITKEMFTKINRFSLGEVTNVNLDSLTKPGVYSTRSSSGVSGFSQYSGVIVLKGDNSTSSSSDQSQELTDTIQICIDREGQMAVRSSIDQDSWKSWRVVLSRDDIVNDLATEDNNKVLSATQGKVLKQLIDSKSELPTEGAAPGKILSIDTSNRLVWTTTTDAELLDAKVHNLPAELRDLVRRYGTTFSVVIDQNNSNPDSSVTYSSSDYPALGSSDWDKIFGYYPVLFKDGKEVAKVNPNDFTKLEDGTSITQEMGDVMIAFPKRGLTITNSSNKITITLDLLNHDICYAHLRGDEPQDTMYIGAYLGYESDNKLRSVSGVRSTVGKTIGAFRTLTQNNGVNYHQMNFYQLTYIQALGILKYKSIDFQSAVGKGYTRGSEDSRPNTGSLSTRGLCYGDQSGTTSMKLFGIEDFFGSTFYWIDGLFCDSEYNILTSTKVYNDNGSGYTNVGKYTSSDLKGFVSNTVGTSRGGSLPIEFSGSSSTYYSDYSYLYSGCLPIFGGYWSDGSSAGGFRLCVIYQASSADPRLGSRVSYT